MGSGRRRWSGRAGPVSKAASGPFNMTSLVRVPKERNPKRDLLSGFPRGGFKRVPGGGGGKRKGSTRAQRLLPPS